MRDAVLFDLDGTLLDSIELILESYLFTLDAHALPPRTAADILAGLGTTLEDQFIRWGYADRVEALVQTYIDFNLREHDRLVKPYPGLDAIVRDLRAAGTPLGLVTSKRRRGGEMGLRALGLAQAFDVTIYGDEVERPKPDPDPVYRALRGLSLEPSERVTFVGDAVHDVEAGRAAGIHTIAVSWGAGRREELTGAHALVDDAESLRALLF